MRWRSLPIVAFDTETTGLEPFAGDRVIEFAAVVLHLGPDGRVANRQDHAWLVNPQIPIPRKVTEITGISDQQVAGAPTFADIAGTVRELLANAITVAHNYPFDLAFLTQEFLRVGQHWPEPLAEVDTVDLSMRCFPDARSHKLVDVAERLAIRLDGAHRATNDAAACGLSFTALAERHAVADELQAMLDWANAIGRPPDTGPIGTDPATGRVVFTEGPHAGRPVAEQPVHLAWTEKARVRGQNGWDWRFDEPVRRWVRRWLDVRGSGRATQNPKTLHAEDWGLDSCIAVEPAGALG
jgi:DNA polymerase III epsilon subunit family exonuclease